MEDGEIFLIWKHIGTVTNLPWRMGIVETNMYLEVHPTFLYESICTFFLFILLTILSNKRKFNGQITYLYLILYSFVRIFIENLRVDSLMIGNYKVSQILSIIVFIVFSNIYIIKRFKNLEKED